MIDVHVLTTPAELLESQRVFRAAMVGLPSMPVTEDEITSLREPGRTYGVYDDGKVVGTTDSALGTLTLPGGARVPHTAVTHVGVLSTHTRRGIVSALLRRQLRDARDAGEVVASLRASEAVIYGRYGYGVATSSVTAEVIVARAGVRDDAVTSGRVTLLDTGDPVDTDGPPTTRDAFGVQAEIVDSHPSPRPGTISRHPTWWTAARRRGAADTDPVWTAVHSAGGYVRYRPLAPRKWWSGEDRRVVVEDLHAPDDAVFADLVRFLLRLDLVDRITFPALPVDTVLPLLMHDRRSVRLHDVEDETWLRILDVHAALSARTYGAADAVSIAVHDADLPENSATYRVGPDGVRVTDTVPDVTVDVRELASVLLGGTSWVSLVAAGLATGDPTGADALFRTPSAPFAGVSF